MTLCPSLPGTFPASSVLSPGSQCVGLSYTGEYSYLDGGSTASPSVIANPSSYPPASSILMTSASPPPVTNHMRILLMLDMQKCMLEDEPVGVPAAETVFENLKQVLAAARASIHPPLIIHVRNVGEPGEPDERDTPGWELIFDPLPNEVVIDKRKNNAFAGTELGALVDTDAEIVVVGFQTDFSVRATCSTALGRGNEVMLIKETHATYDRIEVLHGGGVTAAAVIEAEIEAELEEAGVHIFEMKDLPGIFSDR